MKNELIFHGYYANTTTKSGKVATIFKNNTNIYRQYYQVLIERKSVCSRCSLPKVFEILENN